MKPALVLAPLLALALTTPTPAGEARASGNVAVLAGPGSGYPIVDRLVDGAYYEVEDCTRRQAWCLVSDTGEILGWVRGSSIIGSPAKLLVTPFEFLVQPLWRRHD